MGMVIAAISMFSYIVADQLERAQIREAENAQLKIDILMAQIRPHFLINSLTSIKYLIAYDAKKADEAMISIIKYLRHNIDSLMTDRMSPFKDELEHVKAYLELQILRFGDELKVEYDLECTDFTIPSLTLLPLVANAVSYGIRRNEDRSGCVIIRSREYDDRIEVSVEDDGPGFVPDTLPDDEEKSQIGMRNVRERIERVAGGKLIIESIQDKGTTSTIKLPHEG
jgi:sensor histidine kinase YesM